MKKIIPGIVALLIFTFVAEGLYLLAAREDAARWFGAVDPKNATYHIAGEPITLVGGVSEKPAAPGSASLITTRYFGNEAVIDLDKDGRMDLVFLITQSSGGSGTFFYLAGALDTPSGYVGTNAMFIGDRIAPQSTVVDADKGTIIVNYADRKAGEGFAVQPSVGKSLYALYDQKTNSFGEWVKDFEGESR